MQQPTVLDNPRSSQTSIHQQQSVADGSSSTSLSSTSDGVFTLSIELNKKPPIQQQQLENPGDPQHRQQQIDQQLQLQQQLPYDHDLTNEEVHLLWVDIAKKVFHLKKNICESVEHWNHK